MPTRLAAMLPPTVVADWHALSAFDRQHLLTVAVQLEARRANRDLVLAGLLHDIGKPSRAGILARALVVLLPRRARWLSEAMGRAGIAVCVASQVLGLIDHASVGSERLRSAGMSNRVVALVRQHHDPGEGDADLRALKRADDVASARKRAQQAW